MKLEDSLSSTTSSSDGTLEFPVVTRRHHRDNLSLNAFSLSKQFYAFISLPWRDKIRPFMWLNLLFKCAKIWLNSCDSYSSSRSQWRSCRKTMICSRSSKQTKTLPRESQRTSVWKSKTVCLHLRSSQSDSKRLWFRARPLIQLTVFTEISRTFFNFRSQDFWRQRMTMNETVGALPIRNLLFHQCRKPRFISREAGAPSMHTDPIFWTHNSCFAKKSFTNWNTFFTLVVVFSSSHKRKFFMTPSSQLKSAIRLWNDYLIAALI